MDKTTTDPPATSQATTTQPPEDASSIRCQSTEPPESSLAVSCEAADKETVEHKKETYEYIADLTKRRSHFRTYVDRMKNQLMYLSARTGAYGFLYIRSYILSPLH